MKEKNDDDEEQKQGRRTITLKGKDVEVKGEENNDEGKEQRRGRRRTTTEKNNEDRGTIFDKNDDQ